ncbi:hypothetical protein PAMC26510_07685 [Caballeronia sordidicola]|uniref:Uncharacterized protein n=1 Tax=Caballeronia sordidicola TaxID=196367 RepID=A0A242N332_CABSO|nr:hypothetical protein PAMC26510_07685 [Caballeronia sordidicola]
MKNQSDDGCRTQCGCRDHPSFAAARSPSSRIPDFHSILFPLRDDVRLNNGLCAKHFNHVTRCVSKIAVEQSRCT